MIINLSYPDIAIILGFLIILFSLGFIFSGKHKTDEDYLLFGRKTPLLLFIMTNVSTWYGGILAVGEFTYSYGLMNWFTQGLPYYIFAGIFALLLAGKIRKASLFTIPDKIEQSYGKPAAIFAGVIVFILVSPAPYILMVGTLISMIFNIPLLWSLIIGMLLTVPYIMKGGYRADVLTDAFSFAVMFIGFVIVIFISYTQIGDLHFLSNNLPDAHLTLTGGASPLYIAVWFFIALWTFVDPGFHQRCYAAKSPEIAKKGILISIGLWLVFDIMTTLTGLYAKAYLPALENPVMAFPALAESILGRGIKGLFYAALLATILSTLNSFVFLSAGTFSRDLVYRISRRQDKVRQYTYLGILISSLIAILMAYLIPSVVNLWYTIGSICIPGIILPVIAAYYPSISINGKYTLIEMILGTLISIAWYIMRSVSNIGFIQIMEPMIIGLTASTVFHMIILSVNKCRINFN